MKRIIVAICIVFLTAVPVSANDDDCKASERCCEPSVGNPCTIGG